jgi:hypothetical protein
LGSPTGNSFLERTEHSANRFRQYHRRRAILVGLAISAWLVRESAESKPLIKRGGVIFSLVLDLGFNLLYVVNDLLAKGYCLISSPGAIAGPHRGARAAFHRYEDHEFYGYRMPI